MINQITCEKLNEINYQFQLFFDYQQLDDIHILTDIFSFIYFSHPTLSLIGYKFNDNSYLDTINPAYFYQFRSFKLPCFQQLKYIEKDNLKDIFVQQYEKIDDFKGIQSSIRYLEEEPTFDIQVNFKPDSKSEFQVMKKDTNTFIIADPKGKQMNNMYYDESILFFEIFTHISGFQVNYYYEVQYPVVKRIDENGQEVFDTMVDNLIFNQFPIMKKIKDQFQIEFTIQDQSQKDATNALIQIIKNSEIQYQTRIEQYLSNIYQERLLKNKMFSIQIMKYDVQDSLQQLINETTQQKKHLGKVVNFQLIFPSIETHHFVQSFVNSYNRLVIGNQGESCLIQNLTQSSNVLIFDIRKGIIKDIEDTLNDMLQKTVDASQNIRQKILQLI